MIMELCCDIISIKRVRKTSSKLRGTVDEDIQDQRCQTIPFTLKNALLVEPSLSMTCTKRGNVVEDIQDQHDQKPLFL